ncbi:putative small secreted protein [Salsuginibacillus halophilus]|uniref:Putative small secreted protein n=1 Tax=Salsuginibacillus halophilus TaxID=517424 RepID=A0A2P8HEB6_9BACI|nr:PepSY domain-containing protein [Salsuginibacillus halophilus]PSL44535.1 putative small secreted protein [Salsuginibacillus halophilus]
MRLKDVLIGAGLGFVAGYALKEALETQPVSPEKALKHVKENVQETLPINGSWIHMKPETYEKDDLAYEVYKGGISSTLDGETKQFDFVVDAQTGTILEMSS